MSLFCSCRNLEGTIFYGHEYYSVFYEAVNQAQERHHTYDDAFYQGLPRSMVNDPNLYGHHPSVGPPTPAAGASSFPKQQQTEEKARINPLRLLILALSNLKKLRALGASTRRHL